LCRFLNGSRAKGDSVEDIYVKGKINANLIESREELREVEGKGGRDKEEEEQGRGKEGRCSTAVVRSAGVASVSPDVAVDVE